MLGRIFLIIGGIVLLLGALFNTTLVLNLIPSLTLSEFAQENNGWLVLLGSVLIIIAIVRLLLHHSPENSEDESP
jgi:hypothetical protein